MLFAVILRLYHCILIQCYLTFDTIQCNFDDIGCHFLCFAVSFQSVTHCFFHDVRIHVSFDMKKKLYLAREVDNCVRQYFTVRSRRVMIIVLMRYLCSLRVAVFRGSFFISRGEQTELHHRDRWPSRSHLHLLLLLSSVFCVLLSSVFCVLLLSF